MGGKVALLFAGQGAQRVGMGADLLEEHDLARQVFAEAGQVLGWDVAELCLSGPPERLADTRYQQPAVVTLSYALYRLLMAGGLKPHAAAGHSLGEYNALAAAGAFTFPDCLRLVARRGQLMAQACPEGGAMAAILGLSAEEVRRLCVDVDGTVEPANFNCPGQVVISGEAQAVDQACRLALVRGARRAVPLKVSGPFHSSLMRPAAQELAALLENTSVRDIEMPVVANATADFVRTSEETKRALVEQLAGPVHWEQSMRLLLDKGFTDFVEVGPGNVLTGLMRRIDRKVRTYTVNDSRSLDKTLSELL